MCVQEVRAGYRVDAYMKNGQCELVVALKRMFGRALPLLITLCESTVDESEKRTCEK